MTLNLAEVQFENDFFSIDLPDGNTLTLNAINENILISTNRFVIINRVNVQVTSYKEDGSVFTEPCSNVIGIKMNNLKIDSLYKEYKGKVLTLDNMKYCTVDYYEQ